MQSVASNLINSWSQVNTQSFRQASFQPQDDTAANGSTTKTNQTTVLMADGSMQQIPSQTYTYDGKQRNSGRYKEANKLSNTAALRIPRGTMLYAVLDIGANSDEPSMVAATVVSGPLQGSRFFTSTSGGELTGFLDQQMTLSFDSILLSGGTKTQAVTAVAVDTNTARSALNGDVNNHIMLRYGSLILTSFISGVGDAITNAGSTNTTSEGTTTTVYDDLSNPELITVGLGNAASDLSDFVDQWSDLDPTVTINSGTTVGIMFITDTEIKVRGQNDSYSDLNSYLDVR